MIDVNRLVGEIRAFLQAADRTADSRMANLATNYSAACAQANERLNRCGSFLRQGLRSEALQLAEADPNLLDMVAVLDFPERPEWESLALAYGWPKTPALAIEQAQALNTAYAEAHPLEDLLRKHRRLALVRAPLARRLVIMRQIRQLDPNNPIWAEDIARFEQARCEELEKEIRLGRADLDSVRLEAIVQELETTEWSSGPNGALTALAGEAAAHAKREEARMALASLIAPLHRAHADKDFAMGQQLRARWEALSAAAAVSSGSTLAGQAQPVFDWLQREDRRLEREQAFHETIQDIERVLDGEGDRRTLPGLEQEALEFGRSLPKLLELRLKEYHRAQQRSTRRRNRVAVATAVGMLLLFWGIVAWSNARLARQQEIEKTAAKVQALVQSGALKEAEEALDRLETTYPEASETDAFAPASIKLREAQRVEAERVGRFTSALDKAREESVLPDPAPKLEEARSLARLPNEKAQVSQLEKEREGILALERERVDRKLTARVDPLREEVDDAERLFARAPADKATREARAKLRKIAAGLKSDAGAASEAVRTEALALVARIERLDAAASQKSEQEGLLDNLARAAGSIDQVADLARFQEAGRAYVARFPDGARANALRTMAGELPMDRAIIAWGVMARDWRRPLTVISPKVAGARLRQLMDFQRDHPRFPDDGAMVEQYRRLIEAIARREKRGDEDVLSSLRRLMENRLVEHLWSVSTYTKKTYYSLQEPALNQLGCNISYLMDIDCNTAQVLIRNGRLLARGFAPQTRLADRLKAMLASADSAAESWERTIIKALEAVRKEEADLDPIVRVIFVKTTLQVASQSSALLAEAVADHVAVLDKAGLDPDVNWVDPDDAKASVERKKARDTLARLPEFGPCTKRVDEVRKRLESAIGRFYWPIGLLVKDEDGMWRCRCTSNPNGEIFTVSPGGPWKKVGKGQGARAAPVIELTDELVEGQLVFVQREAR